MRDKKFSPGPWRHTPVATDSGIVSGKDGRSVASVHHQELEETWFANVAMIAAAPALYEALSDLLATEIYDDDDPRLIASREKARAAIQLAREGR